MMDKKEFFEYVKDNVKKYLPASFANVQISLREETKNNDQVLTGISIPDGNSGIVPIIYLDQMYGRYLDGEDPDKCVGDVADLRVNYTVPEFDIDINSILDYGSIKDRLQMFICDIELNQKWLEGKAVTLHGDFAAYYKVNVSEGKGENAGIPITESMLKLWGVGTGQLHQDALAADKRRGVALMSMDDMLAEMAGGKAENLLDGGRNARDFEMPMFCLTNGSRMNGASLILNEDVRKQIGEFMEGDFFIFPSSIHEVIILPDNGSYDVAALKAMVQAVNETGVGPDDLLSDKVQYCDWKTAVMENAEKREHRKF